MFNILDKELKLAKDEAHYCFATITSGIPVMDFTHKFSLCTSPSIFSVCFLFAICGITIMLKACYS